MSETPTSPSSQRVVEAPELDGDGAGKRVRNFSSAGAWGFFLAAFYAILVRFYHVAGGEIGATGTVYEEYEAEARMGGYLAGLIILCGGAACLILAYRQFRTYPRWVPVLGGKEAAKPLMTAVVVVPSMLGGLYAIVHGLGAELINILDLTGAIEFKVPSQWETYDALAATLWDALFYEMWFFAMGTCLLLSALQYARDTNTSQRTIRKISYASVGVGVAGFILIMIVVLSQYF